MPSDGASVTGYYRCVQGLEVVSIGGDQVLLRSEAGTVKIEGASAQSFLGRLLPYLDHWRSLDELAAFFADIRPDDLTRQLEALVQPGILHRRSNVQTSTEANPLLSMIELLGVPAHIASEALAQTVVTIFGLEHCGAYAATMLAQAGVAEIRLVDPYPLERGNLVSMPGASESDVGQQREIVVRDRIALQVPSTRCTVSAAAALDRSSISKLATGSNVLLACFDRGFSAAHQWVNRASLELGIPAIFAELAGQRALVGPLVLPGESACYLCWRMRYIAARSSFAETMAFEEHDKARRAPSAYQRPLLFPLAASTGSMLTTELLKMILSLSPPTLINAIQEIDGLANEFTRHTFLQRPDCPVCAGVVRPVQAAVHA